MSSKDFIGQSKKHLVDFLLPDRERIEKLRQILETEQKRSIAYEEAEEVGVQLISFYECLAGDRKIVPGNKGVSDELTK